MPAPLTNHSSATPIRTVAQVILLGLGAGLTTYLILTGPTYWTRLNYWWFHRNQPKQAQVYIDTAAPAQSFASAVAAALRQPTFQVPTQAATSSRNSTETDLGVTENVLVVPKLSIRAPIIWNSSSVEKVMLGNLQHGVAHYGFTALPNADGGNVFITGHSSYYWWDPGQYKTVFALLDQLSTGDQAIIQFQDVIYVYQLRDERVVAPSDLSVTDPTKEPILSLMTCVPVGTSLRRLVARFDLAKTYPVSPKAAALTPSTSNASPQPTAKTPKQRDRIRLVPGLH